MKRGFAAAALLGCAVFWQAPPTARGQVTPQSIPVKDAAYFSSSEYFDPPNGLVVSSRMSGAEALPVSANLMLIKHMKLETFETNGAPKYIIEAPECLYDHDAGVAKSAGPLKVRPADSQWVVTGVGFLWQQDESFLTISNQTHTVIQNGSNLKVIP